MSAASSEQWFLLDSGACDYAFNMALDETLLTFAPQLDRPVLRFYGWRQPAASFGYSQKIASIEAATYLRPLVRRPTGGGLVPHDADWTYSVAIPPSHSWYALRAADSYERIHRWIQDAFAKVEVATELAPCCRKEIPGQCFAGYEQSDLLWYGRKIAGAAQRRTANGLLIQGSIQPPPPGILRAAWQTAMTAAAAAAWGAQFELLDLSPERAAHATQLASEKFSQDDHNRRR
jgi:lipoyl(octanoyl) transferase